MFALIVAGLLAALPMNSPPTQTGKCKWVHGRFAIYNGSGIRRIWLIGTPRIIHLWDWDNGIPPAVRRYQRSFPDNQNDPLFGDFYVCAREPSVPGHMQHVRLVRTKNLIFKGKPFG
jgi:hypothetical protein